MPSLVSATCPRCGAAVKIDPKLEYVTCAYCQTSSFIQRGREAPPAHVTSVVRVAPARGPARLFIALVAAFGVLFAAGAVTLALVLHAPRTTGAPSAGSIFGDSLQFADRALLADVNRDGTADVIGYARTYSGGERHWVGAYDGRNGHELWRITTLDKASLDTEGRRAVVGDRLVVIDGVGKVFAFDIHTGQPSWSRVVAEKPRDVCAGGDFVGIETVDGQTAAFGLASGDRRPAPAQGTCGPAFVGRGSDAPDYRIVDWPQFTALGIPELTDVTGMMAYRALVPLTGRTRFLLGSRTPGTQVAMVAAVENKRIVWKGLVPGVDPLTTGVNVLTQVAALGHGRLVIPYELGFGGTSGIRLACLEAATGKRLWDVPIEGVKNSVSNGLSMAEGQVFYTTWTSLHAFSLADGKARWVLGTPM